ncbi:MAG TPA: DUF2270 domain-containing protein [Anaerolineales bacterium]|nr:DUF2270 domain-containing protein [Anaerolineales bacterium]HMZ44085.1 DUF2270 domain-containing protein [Anaerolineales bacterium]HNA55387.1 DUF2270 domain-containing protein [Anaerolineales bacterium]HND92943.1 DUF2270 domain-containing protein [Anaerolineales bacterium]HNF35700.1 DUF2270 domain-containing protein [Anaerolineales bacterium]
MAVKKSTKAKSKPKQEEPIPVEEPVWTYRGYRLKTSEFVTAMVHFFRAEIQRANVWRTRLDTTTNWAVVVTGATLSIAFSQSNVHHSVVLLNTLLVLWFLFIEARRYRYYELWSYRVRLMETDFYAAMLVPPFHPSPEWAENLAENLLTPSFPISMWEAFGRRLRRNYYWIFLILLASWVAKIYLFPEAPASMSEFVVRSSVGPVPGEVMIGLGISFYTFLAIFAIATINMTKATGEILPRFGDESAPAAPSMEGKHTGLRALLVPRRRRRQLLALIITDKADSVSGRIMTDLKRGVTSMLGKGMYTGKDRSILMCALTITEVHNLKSAVAKEDPKAVVIVSPAQEVFGGGFAPLEEK